MLRCAARVSIALLLALLSVAARSENASKSNDDPVLEPPTLHSLGAYWIIKGDDNRNAKVEVAYRKAGAKDWLKGFPFFRVQKGAPNGEHCREKHSSKLDIPKDAWLFAGSLLMLVSDTEYEIKLTLSDPDGGNAEKTLKARTNAEPTAPKDAPVYHVVPGSGGGSGTAGEPFKGFEAAQNKAKPGDIFLVHGGTYPAPVEITKSGEPGRPIIWRGLGDSEAVIEGKAKDQGGGIFATGIHDVWFEKLSVRKAHNLFKLSGSSRIVVRRCHASEGIYGIFGLDDKTSSLFISDNLFEGSMPWPTTSEEYAKLPESRGVWMLGTGHEVCYNRLHHWKDGTDTGPSRNTTAVDFHNNDISECFDDGTEMDGSERNTRCFFNRYTNIFQGISVQPIYGGPIYIFRNVLYNVQVEPFKLHNSPSGGLFIHNTVVRHGEPLMLGTQDKVFNCYFRNNLFIGTTGYAYQCGAPMSADCDFDNDGFGGNSSSSPFLKWNEVRYGSLAEVKAKAPVYKHAVVVDPATVFAAGIKAPEDDRKAYPIGLDLRLAAGTAAIDSAEVLPGINDGFAGNGPDLGAYELGWQLPHYGPRPEGMDEQTAFRAYEPAKAGTATASTAGTGTSTPAVKTAVAPPPAIDPVPHREALQKLLQGAPAKKNVKANIKVMGRTEDTVIKEMDKNGLKVVLMGNDLPLRWKDISDEDLARIAAASLEADAQALFHAGALAASAGINNLRDKISDRLVVLDAAKSKELDKLVGKGQ